MSFAVSRFSFATVAGTSAPKTFVLFQSDVFNVREKTYFGSAFMKSAISPLAVGQ